MKNRNQEPVVPKNTELSGIILFGFKIITASDRETAVDCINMARVNGSTGGSSYLYKVAGPSVMPEDREVDRWAIVERAKGVCPTT